MKEPFKEKTLMRLKKARGQLEAIINMVEKDTYCIDILTQVLALQGALKGLSPVILESHLNTCAAEHLNSKDSEKKDKFIKELIRTFDLSRR